MDGVRLTSPTILLQRPGSGRQRVAPHGIALAATGIRGRRLACCTSSDALDGADLPTLTALIFYRNLHYLDLLGDSYL